MGASFNIICRRFTIRRIGFSATSVVLRAAAACTSCSSIRKSERAYARTHIGALASSTNAPIDRTAWLYSPFFFAILGDVTDVQQSKIHQNLKHYGSRNHAKSRQQLIVDRADNRPKDSKLQLRKRACKSKSTAAKPSNTSRVRIAATVAVKPKRI